MKRPHLLAFFFLFCAMLRAQDRVIVVDPRQITEPHSMTPLNTVGAGRANEGLRADWQSQLAMVQREIGFHYLRFHGLLDDDMGVYRETSAGTPILNYQYVDVLYDAMLADHIRPFVELSFMPLKLASGTQTQFWYKGNVTPPKDYAKWDLLIRSLVRHWIQRYSEAEVDTWYFEVWNEPDLPQFWSGTQEQYDELYRHTAEDIKAVCMRCRVGGPAAARFGEQAWLKFISANHVPADFLSAHTYGVTRGALDVDGHAQTVLDVDPNSMVGRVKSSREYIRESDTPGLELHYTEWSSSYTPTDPLHDQYLEASFILEKLRQTATLAQSMSYWTFTDIFEEQGPPVRAFHGGFGLLNLQGIKKPAYFAYNFLSRLGSEDLKTTDPHSWITRKDDGSIQALIWDFSPVPVPAGESDQTFFNKLQPAHEIPATKLRIAPLPEGLYHATVYRVGFGENDAYTVYLRLGAPAQLTRDQVSQLKAIASGDPAESTIISVKDGSWSREFPMRSNEVVLLLLEPMHGEIADGGATDK